MLRMPAQGSRKTLAPSHLVANGAHEILHPALAGTIGDNAKSAHQGRSRTQHGRDLTGEQGDVPGIGPAAAAELADPFRPLDPHLK